MNRSDLTIIGPLCYQGKKGCRDVRCTRLFLKGKMSEDCMGYHCSYCDAACGSQGHSCDAAKTFLAESERILREQGQIK